MEKQIQKTMSVCNMGKLLGLKKVEAYWLIHKGYFETVTVSGRMRVVVDSFERWYAGQARYHKITGEPPGKLLREESYSVREIAEILQINEMHAYEVLKDAGIRPVLVDGWQRFRRVDFETWYAGQTHYRNEADRQRDAEAEEASMSMPDMARLLDVPRQTVYKIMRSHRGREILDVVIIANQKRITKESFERWYQGQTKYLKPEDRSFHPEARELHYRDCLASAGRNKPKKKQQPVRPVTMNTAGAFVSIEQAAYMAGTNRKTITRWIQQGKIPCFKTSGGICRIPRKAFCEYLASKNPE